MFSFLVVVLSLVVLLSVLSSHVAAIDAKKVEDIDNDKSMKGLKFDLKGMKFDFGKSGKSKLNFKGLSESIANSMKNIKVGGVVGNDGAEL